MTVRPSLSTVTRSATAWISRHPVGDVDDRDALGAQSLHEIQQPRRVDAIERGGRLVHDENTRVDRKGLGDLDDLLLGDREIASGASGGIDEPSRRSRRLASSRMRRAVHRSVARGLYCRERRSPPRSGRATGLVPGG